RPEKLERSRWREHDPHRPWGSTPRGAVAHSLDEERERQDDDVSERRKAGPAWNLPTIGARLLADDRRGHRMKGRLVQRCHGPQLLPLCPLTLRRPLGRCAAKTSADNNENGSTGNEETE